MTYQIDSRLHKTFIDNVKARRAELDMTQAEVAVKMGVSQSAYAQIECGRNTPTLEIVERVAKALKLNPLELLSPKRLATIS